MIGIPIHVVRRVSAAALVAILAPVVAFAQQAPWEHAANNLALTFTGPLARSLALVAIVIGGLLCMFGDRPAAIDQSSRPAATKGNRSGGSVSICLTHNWPARPSASLDQPRVPASVE
jgi:hypothetical protein